MNKQKVINDPVTGFVTLRTDLIYDVLEHPYFQRLRRIKQLGLTDLVYPGAVHTRFHHALGAMNLMESALNALRYKGYQISDEEFEAALLAILLHDIGHGPYSHVLEHQLLSDTSHESLSLLFMQQLNHYFDGRLSLAISIFRNTYHRPFFHQLVSSQLDVDRMDYLNRDCYFTGVSEGQVGADRIIKMLELHHDEIVVEEKGIYSIENFLNARRLMYWQVYLHRTAICGQVLLGKIIERASVLLKEGKQLEASESLKFFLQHAVTYQDFISDLSYLDVFARIDDFDIMNGIKMWINHDDYLLSLLCRMFLNRQLYKIHLANENFEEASVHEIDKKILRQYKISEENLSYLRVKGVLTNAAYIETGKTINILTKEGSVIDVAMASDLPNIKAMSKIVKKYYLCVPPGIME